MSSKCAADSGAIARGQVSGKRKRAYYKPPGGGGNLAKKQKKRDLGSGMRGFIISYPRGREQAALRDSLALLGEYADRLYGAADGDGGHAPNDLPTAPARAPDEEEEQEDDDDIAAALERESRALRGSSGGAREKPERFTPMDSRVNQLLFIGCSSSVDSPTRLVEAMLEDVASKKAASLQASRNVLRVLPVQLTCKAEHDKMEAGVEQVARSYFGERLRPDEAFSYSIVYKSRNNSSSVMHRDVVIPKVADTLHRCYPSCRVDLTDPDFFLLVEVLRTVCCISIVAKYFQYKKFNLQELCAASLGTALDGGSAGGVKLDGDAEGDSSAAIAAATAAEPASHHRDVMSAPEEGGS